MPNNAGDVGDDDHDQCPGSRPAGEFSFTKWILLRALSNSKICLRTL